MLTGTIDLPPLWALGFQQCKYSYFPDDRVKEIADKFREHQIPCDVIWMDIDYMDGYRVFTFDKNTFPNPKELNAYLHKKDFKAVYMIDPGVKNEKGYFVYDSGSEGDHWLKHQKIKILQVMYGLDHAYFQILQYLKQFHGGSLYTLTL